MRRNNLSGFVALLTVFVLALSGFGLACSGGGPPTESPGDAGRRGDHERGGGASGAGCLRGKKEAAPSSRVRLVPRRRVRRRLLVIQTTLRPVALFFLSQRACHQLLSGVRIHLQPLA